jgi:hypothetical protein
MLVSQAMSRVFGGVASGLFLAWWSARSMQSLLYEVRPHDPTIFAGVAGLPVLTSLTAILVPVEKIRRIDLPSHYGMSSADLAASLAYESSASGFTPSG